MPGKAVLFVGLHLGTVELAVIFLAFQVGETVTPMETIDDPGLQAYFERTRGVAGIRLVGLREARRELTRALAQRHPGRPRRRSRPDRRRHPDRAVRGARDAADGSGHARGRERRPDLRDDRPARWDGPVPRQADPDRRPGRRHATRARHDDDDPPGGRLRDAHRRRARPVVGDLLPDLARSRGRGGDRGGRATAPARIVGERRHDGRAGPGHGTHRHAHPGAASRPRRPAHPHPGQRRHRRHRGHPRPRRAPDRPRRHRHHRPRADRRRAGGPDDRPRSRPARGGRRRRGGHDARRSPAGALRGPARSGRSARCAARSWPSTTPAAWRSRPIRWSRSRCAPRAGCCAGCSTIPIPRHTPTASRRSTRRRSASRGTAAWCASPTSTASPTSATATPTRSTRSAPAGRPSRAATRPSSGAPSRRGTTEHGGTVPPDRRPARHVRTAAPQARPRRPRRGRRPRPPRRHRPRPRLSRRPAAPAAVRDRRLRDGAGTAAGPATDR